MMTTRDISERPSSPCTAHEMHGHAPAASPDSWVFNLEAVATLGIAGWYVYGVCIQLGLLPASAFYHWGDAWVVPLLLAVFYLGAGYLYQRYQKVYSVAAWGRYMKREFIVLATPFVAFTVLVLVTNSILHASPNLTLAHLGAALTVSPVVPVGYFEVLFFIFVLTHTPRTSRGMAGLLAAALAAKIAIVICSEAGIAASWIYALQEVPANWIWFVGGIAVSFYGLEPRLARGRVTAVATAVFVIVGVTLYVTRQQDPAFVAVLIALGLLAAFSLSARRFGDGSQDTFFGFVTRYTMAIWLMHEIVAKLTMAGLTALGISTSGILALACLIACYVFPVLIMALLSRIGKLGFIVYPSRYLPKEL